MRRSLTGQKGGTGQRRVRLGGLGSRRLAGGLLVTLQVGSRGRGGGVGVGRSRRAVTAAASGGTVGLKEEAGDQRPDLGDPAQRRRHRHHGEKEGQEVGRLHRVGGMEVDWPWLRGPATAFILVPVDPRFTWVRITPTQGYFLLREQHDSPDKVRVANHLPKQHTGFFFTQTHKAGARWLIQGRLGGVATMTKHSDTDPPTNQKHI